MFHALEGTTRFTPDVVDKGGFVEWNNLVPRWRDVSGWISTSTPADLHRTSPLIDPLHPLVKHLPLEPPIIPSQPHPQAWLLSPVRTWIIQLTSPPTCLLHFMLFRPEVGQTGYRIPNLDLYNMTSFSFRCPPSLSFPHTLSHCRSFALRCGLACKSLFLSHSFEFTHSLVHTFLDGLIPFALQDRLRVPDLELQARRNDQRKFQNAFQHDCSCGGLFGFG